MAPPQTIPCFSHGTAAAAVPPAEGIGIVVKTAAARGRQTSGLGVRQVVPNDNGQVPEQQDERSGDINNQEFHKSAKPSTLQPAGSLVTGKRRHSHLAR
jgi:hypothetical protein